MNMHKKTGLMYFSCGLILSAGLAVFAILLIALREMIYAEPLMSAHAAGIYSYCIGAAVPCASAVGMLMMVIREIGHDCAFTECNARWMRGISVMAALECVYILAGLIGWSAVGIMHPGVIILALALVMFGAGVSILALSLARLIHRASDIQRENDLTI